MKVYDKVGESKVNCEYSQRGRQRERKLSEQKESICFFVIYFYIYLIRKYLPGFSEMVADTEYCDNIAHYMQTQNHNHSTPMVSYAVYIIISGDTIYQYYQCNIAVSQAIFQVIEQK